MRSIPFLLDAAAKATMILLAAWLLTVIMRRSSAAARFFIWTCALGALLAVPAIAPLLSRWEVRVQTPAMAAAPPEVSTAIPHPVVLPAHAGPALAWPMVIWLAGAIVMLLRVGVGHFRLALSLRRAP